MTAFEIQINDGCLKNDIEPHELDAFEKLFNIGSLEEVNGLWRLKSIYRSGRLYISKPPNQKGFVEANKKSQKDLVVEIDDIGDANNGDIVVVKRIIARRGRASAKVVLVIEPAHIYSIGYTHRDSSNNFSILNIKTALPTDAFMNGMDLKVLKQGTVLKIDDATGEVLEILGNLEVDA